MSIFSAKAQWMIGYINSAMPQGVLDLSESGRLSFTTTDGKLVFSAPIALTMYSTKFDAAGYHLSVVVGESTYNLNFGKHIEYTNAYSGNLFELAQNEASSKKKLEVLAPLLEQAKQKGDDGQPLFDMLASADQKRFRRSSFIMLYAMLLVTFLIIGVGLALGVSRIITIIVFIVLSPIYFQLARRLLKPVNTETTEQSVLAPGTLPTGKLGYPIFKILFLVLAPIFIPILLIILYAGFFGPGSNK